MYCIVIDGASITFVYVGYCGEAYVVPQESKYTLPNFMEISAGLDVKAWKTELISNLYYCLD